jgi:NADPH:quinone reductase
MRAVVVTEYGGRAEEVEIPTPEAQAGQLLIKVQAAGMNPVEKAIAAGAWQAFMPATFPMILGFDVAGIIEAMGPGANGFAAGEAVMGQLLAPPVGAFGTYAEYVAVSADATLARVPDGMDVAVAASAPTAGMTGLAIVESLGSLDGRTVLIVGAAGGVGSFATQFAVVAGAHVIANAQAVHTERMEAYGVGHIVDHTTGPLTELVRQAHPYGIDVLLDFASDADQFAEIAGLVRHGGTALTTKFAADVDALEANDVAAVNFDVPVSRELLQRVADALASGSIVAPPINRISLAEAPAAFAAANGSPLGGKTVIVI